jgi:hypothetical protein
LATQLADVIADNYHQPLADLSDVAYDGPDESGRCVVWAVSAGAAPRMAVVVQSVDEDTSPSRLGNAPRR